MKRLFVVSGMVLALLAVGCGEKEEDSGQPEPRPPAKTGGKLGAEPTPARAPVAEEDSVESLAEEIGVQLEQMMRAMEGVKDVRSAEKASEIVGLVSDEFKSITERLRKLEVPSDEVKLEIKERMEERQEEMMEKLGSQEEFLSSLDDEVRPIVEGAMETFEKTMMEVHPVMAAYFEVEDDSEPPLDELVE